MSSICILPTTRCNLRCKACLNFTNYIKKFENRPLEKLKEEVDLFFSCVGYVGLFFLSGGEPLLYPDIAELIRYIGDNYKNQMYSYEIVTNGTISPRDEVIRAIQETDIKITADDYRDALPEQKEKIEKNFECLLQNCGAEKVIIRKYEEWIDLYPHDIKESDEKELEKKYDRCHVPWQEYRDGKLFSCNYAAFAANAGLVEENDLSETFNLQLFSKDKKKELVEFRLGYSEKGYVEFCRKCAGYLEINPYKVPAAEQGERCCV